ncbi:MAG: SDR family NAD(P)-dependent oxidoreductase, partial [Calditrichaeota bacterium]
MNAPDSLIVLITGGTGGLGKAVTEAFLNAGAKAIVTYTRPEAFADLQARLNHPTNLEGVQANLTEEASVRQVFHHIQQKYPRLDVLAHLVGGFWMGGDISQTPLDRWQQMMQINLTTTFLCVREALGLMKAQGGGRIFTIAARAAVELPAGLGAYAVSKAAVIALTEMLANEGRPYNVAANVILPSIIDTEANRRSMPDADTAQWVTPEAIADVLVALSTGAAGVSGTAIKMYGK